MRRGLTQQEKTTEIYFDEKDPTIFIRTHNTDLKNRLTAYSRKHPAVCKLTDVDLDTGYKEFGLLLAMLPILILYLFLQRYIVEGVTSGAVKG